MQTREHRLLLAHNTLKHTMTNWGLIEDGALITTHSSLLQPVVFDNMKAMVKIAVDVEEHRGWALMICWGGNGAVKVLKHDGDVLLMERATGPKSLKHMVLNGNEVEANKIICGVVTKLHKANCKHMSGLVPLRTWFSDLGHAHAKYGGAFGRCSEIAAQLLDNPLDIVALHGDIHYDNILDSGKGEWVAIDPKGLLGERGFDFANLFCNPTPEIATSAARLKKQLRLIAGEAGLDAKRLLQWIVAWSGLSAAWILDDGDDAHMQITLAENALKELANY